jgi:hypothetical protein
LFLTFLSGSVVIKWIALRLSYARDMVSDLCPRTYDTDNNFVVLHSIQAFTRIYLKKITDSFHSQLVIQ